MFQELADSHTAMRLINYLAIPVVAGVLSLTTLALGDTGRPISVEQDIAKNTTGKYRQFQKNEWKQNTIVHEYENDKGKGYKVLEYELRADGTYMRIYGEGPEAEDFTRDWFKISDSATSTPTQ